MKPNFTLNWIEPVNKKAYGIANVLIAIGIVIMAYVIIQNPSGTVRMILAIVSLILLASRFILGFFLDPTKNAGAIYFFDSELQLIENKKIKDTIPFDSISSFDFFINDFEGETKTKDLLRASTQINVRSGTDNTIRLQSNGKVYELLFKLSSASAKASAQQNLSLLKQKLGAGA